MSHPRRPPIQRFCRVAGIVALIAALAGWGLFLYRNATLLADARAATARTAHEAAVRLDADLAQFVPITNALARELTAGLLAGTVEIEARLRTLLESSPHYEGVGIAFAPEAVGGGRFARYCYRLTRSVEMLAIETRYDYAAGGNLFYDKPMKDGAGWLEPHYTRATRMLVAEYAEPFERTRPDGTTYRAGIVFLNYAVNGVRRLMEELDLGQSGYGFLVSREGAFISHPMEEWVRTHKTLDALARESKSEPLARFAAEARAGRPSGVSYRNELTGQTTWICGEPIPSTGWTIGVVFFEDEVHLDTRQRRRTLIDLTTLLTLAFVLLLVSRVPRVALQDPECDDDLWYLSAGVSIALVAAVVGIWWIVNTGEHDERGDDPPILNRASLERLKTDHAARTEAMRREAPVFIPTGVFVQSLEFTGPNSVRLTGYIWQKFTDGVHDEVARGVVFPESDATDQFEEKYRMRDGETETVGWYFETSLRQVFDYSTYPFDQENITIRMWPADFWKNIMLEPDLASYPVLTPSARPGIERNFVLNGWNLEDSFFSYRASQMNSRFGLPPGVEHARAPELHFNMLVRRSFMNPFITDVLPLSVVVVMLFAALLAVTRDGSRNEFLGFSAHTLIATCAAFYFAVLLGHTQLRDRLQIPNLIYIEHFYFVSYAILLAVTVDGLACAFPDRFPLLVQRDNLLAKVLYFPLAVALLLAATVWTFR